MQNSTLYVKNLNEKIKTEELKMNLFILFHQFGDVLDVHVSTRNQMRGQAFVVFKQFSQCQTALQYLQDFHFFGKPLKIELARETSIAKKISDGSFDYKSHKIQSGDQKQKIKKKILLDEEQTNVLHVSNISQISKQLLEFVFKQYEGFVTSKELDSDSALIFYQNPYEANYALKGLNGFELTPEAILKVTFAQSLGKQPNK